MKFDSQRHYISLFQTIVFSDISLAEAKLSEDCEKVLTKDGKLFRPESDSLNRVTLDALSESESAIQANTFDFRFLIANNKLFRVTSNGFVYEKIRDLGAYKKWRLKNSGDHLFVIGTTSVFIDPYYQVNQTNYLFIYDTTSSSLD